MFVTNFPASRLRTRTANAAGTPEKASHSYAPLTSTKEERTTSRRTHTVPSNTSIRDTSHDSCKPHYSATLKRASHTPSTRQSRTRGERSRAPCRALLFRAVTACWRGRVTWARPIESGTAKSRSGPNTIGKLFAAEGISGSLSTRH